MLGVSLFLVYFILGYLIISYLRSPNSPDWWVKIVTKNPQCTYYFSPFAGSTEAEFNQSGYIEDLSKEGSEGISAEIQQCQPKELTTFEESFEEVSLVS